MTVLSHYFRDWLLPIILFGNIFLLYLSFPCVFCMSFSDTVILYFPGTGTAEDAPQEEHGTLHQIADCGPIVFSLDYINTGYCQGTLLPKMNCSPFKNITRALITSSYVFCLSYSDMMNLNIIRYPDEMISKLYRRRNSTAWSAGSNFTLATPN